MILSNQTKRRYLIAEVLKCDVNTLCNIKEAA